jgi:ubiquinone/menaquinone biosynthesis C-methylase UbiE
MLTQARTGSPDSLRWICAPAEHTTLAQAQFDLVFCVDVVHHLLNRAQVFDEAYRVLRNGGALCVATDSEQIIRRRQPLSAVSSELAVKNTTRTGQSDGVAVVEGDAQERVVRRGGPLIARGLVERAPGAASRRAP